MPFPLHSDCTECDNMAILMSLCSLSVHHPFRQELRNKQSCRNSMQPMSGVKSQCYEILTFIYRSANQESFSYKSIWQLPIYSFHWSFGIWKEKVKRNAGETIKYFFDAVLSPSVNSSRTDAKRFMLRFVCFGSTNNFHVLLWRAAAYVDYWTFFRGWKCVDTHRYMQKFFSLW